MPRKGPSIAVPFTGGLDTKTDSKMTPMGRLQVLENGIFTEHGNVKKRWGYDSFLPIDDSDQPITDARVLADWGDTPVLIGDTKIYTKSDGISRWVDRGRFNASTMEDVTVPRVIGEQTGADCMSNGVITAYAWEDSRGGVRASVVDAQSGFVYVHDYALDANGSKPRCTRSENRVIICWLKVSTNEVLTVALTNGDPAASIAATPNQINNDLNAAVAYDVAYDIDREQAFLCYITSTVGEGLRMHVLDGTGNEIRSNFEDIATDYTVTVNNMTNVAMCVRQRTEDDVLTEVCIVGYDSAGGNGFYVFHEADLTFLSGSASAVSTTGVMDNVAISWPGENSEGTAIRVLAGMSGITDPDDFVLFENLAATTNTLVEKVRHARVGSRCCLADDRPWGIVEHVSNGLQHCHFLYDVWNVEPVARIAYGDAGVATFRDLPGLWSIDGLTVEYCTPIRRRISSIGRAFETGGAGRSTFDNTRAGHTKIALGSASAVQAVYVGETTYLASGTLMAFDGVQVQESAPFMFPENVTVVDDIRGAGTYTDSLVSGSTYLYRVYYERDMANGEPIRSLALTFSYTVGVADTNSEIKLPTLTHSTMKTDGDWRITVYRTEADKTQFFHLVTDADLTNTSAPNNYVANVTSADSITFYDDMDDATLVTKKLDPQTQGVLPVVQPTGASIIGEANDRVFLAGGEGKAGVVYPSLVHFPGEAVLFSDELQFSVEEEGGDITALGAIDGVLCVFKDRRIYAVSGQGPDDTGGSTGSFNVQRVTTDVGCIAPGSVVETPRGLMFQSAKGVYNINRSFDTEYIGWPVEIFNDQVIVSAEVIPDTNLVVFLTSSGSTLVYDYFFEQWSTFTGHAGLSAVVAGGEYHYLRSDGELYTRNQSTHLDAGSWYALRLRTAPIRLDSVQDYLWVRRVNILGEYLGSHRLQMKVFNNRDPFPFETRIFEPDSVIDLTEWGDADTAVWVTYTDGDITQVPAGEGSLASGVTTIPVNTTSGFLASGYVEIDDSFNSEVLHYSSIDATNIYLTTPTTQAYAPSATITEQFPGGDTELWGGTAGDTDYQYQHKFKRRKVQYLRLEFEDLLTNGADGQTYELAEMNFDIGTYDGNARIPARRKM